MKLDTIIKIYAQSVAFASLLTFLIVFAGVMFYPNKSVILDLNHYGEYHIELFLLFTGALANIYMIRKG